MLIGNWKSLNVGYGSIVYFETGYVDYVSTYPGFYELTKHNLGDIRTSTPL